MAVTPISVRPTTQLGSLILSVVYRNMKSLTGRDYLFSSKTAYVRSTAIDIWAN
jgi:hypothetical protein